MGKDKHRASAAKPQPEVIDINDQVAVLKAWWTNLGTNE